MMNQQIVQASRGGAKTEAEILGSRVGCPMPSSSLSGPFAPSTWVESSASEGIGAINVADPPAVSTVNSVPAHLVGGSRGTADNEVVGTSDGPSRLHVYGAWASSSREEQKNVWGSIGQNGDSRRALSGDSAQGVDGGSRQSVYTVEESEECSNGVVDTRTGCHDIDGEGSSGNPGGRGRDTTPVGDEDIDMCSPPLSLIKQRRSRAWVRAIALHAMRYDVSGKLGKH
eukprot:1179956-Prorocentrum_minimum.AAC.2